MKIEPGRFYRTRSGQKARVYAVYSGQKHPVHGAVLGVRGDNEWLMIKWCEDGRFGEMVADESYDLVSEWSDAISLTKEQVREAFMECIGGPQYSLKDAVTIETCMNFVIKRLGFE